MLNLCRLNIYYLLLEKLNSFADSAKYEITNMSGSDIERSYEEKRTDAWHTVENLRIVSRIVSVCRLCLAPFGGSNSRFSARMVQTARSQNNSQRTSSAVSPTSSAGSGSNLRSPPPGRALSSAAAYKKAAVLPPPSHGGAPDSAAQAAPPPYSPSPPANGSSTVVAGAAAAAKKAPPPPPPLKSKPKPKPAVQYVVALYDFTAQVCVIGGQFTITDLVAG